MGEIKREGETGGDGRGAAARAGASSFRGPIAEIADAGFTAGLPTDAATFEE